MNAGKSGRPRRPNGRWRARSRSRSTTSSPSDPVTGGGRRRSSDSFPIILTLAAFVLMFLGQAGYERLADGWMAQRLEPWLGAPAARFVGRVFTVPPPRPRPLYILGGAFFFSPREIAPPSPPPPP